MATTRPREALSSAAPRRSAGHVGVGDVQADEVAVAQQLDQAAGRGGVAERQLGQDVVVADLHAEGLGDHRQLRADVAVADDAEGLAADLVAAVGGLVPLAAVAAHAAGEGLAGQHDHLAEDQLGDRAGVAERRVEHGDAGVAGGGELDLVGADAEGPDRVEPGDGREDAARDAGLAADPEHQRAGAGQAAQGLDQRGLAEAAGRRVHDDPVAGELLVGGRVDVLEQERVRGGHGAQDARAPGGPQPTRRGRHTG
jgi:hypothetical protein